MLNEKIKTSEDIDYIVTVSEEVLSYGSQGDKADLAGILLDKIVLMHSKECTTQLDIDIINEQLYFARELVEKITHSLSTRTTPSSKIKCIDLLLKETLFET